MLDSDSLEPYQGLHRRANRALGRDDGPHPVQTIARLAKLLILALLMRTHTATQGAN